MRRLEWLVAAEADDLADARAASDAKSLSERADEAVAWACVTIVEIARGATDEADLRRRLEGDLAPSLGSIWLRRTSRR